VMFSTYAIHWIRHEVGRGIDDRGRTVRVPDHARIVRRKIREQRDLAEAQGRHIDDEEVAAACGIRVDRLRQIDRDTAPVIPLDSVTGYGSDLDRDDVADPTDLADEAMAQLEEVTALRALLPRLPKARAVVLRHRYGLDGAPELTLAEIGEKLGVSRERARQHQVAALEDLRAMLEHRSAEPRTIRPRRRPSVGV